MLRLGMFVGDRYEILDQVGSGGMSDVYKAKDHKLNRFVAVKVLKKEYSNDKNFVTKFRVEAQSAAGLAHPNIVNVYDVGEEEGIHYIVMELVEGITLKNYIQKKGKLSVKEAISIAIQMSIGIEAAHNNHIIHRDIKPQNIMISRDGKVKVTDFGIARAASSHTIASSVMGSVHYTSPEQARGGYSDEKSDIYSLGITMYEMLTGKVPFDGENTVAIAIQHIQDEMVSPRVYSPDIPISIEQIIFKCTQKSADRRYQNMADVIADLKQSLVNPDEDFVQINPVDNNAKTIMITNDEISKIKEESTITPISFEEEEELEDDDDDDEDDDDEDDDEEMNPKLEKLMTVLGAIALVIIICIILFLGAKTLGLFAGTKSTDDPDESLVETSIDEEDSEEASEDEDGAITMINVVGSTFDEATEELNALGLGIKNAGYENSDLYEEGVIMEQDVEEGEEVEKNTTINVTISSGKEALTVPDVTGLEEGDATSQLEDDYGFVVKVTEDYSSTYKEGYVMSTSPAAGEELEEGDSITIVVSKGEETVLVSVPDLGNMVESEAKATLSYAGLTTGEVSSAYSSSVEEGRVISQSYASGLTLPEGTAVDFVISMGEEPQEEAEYTGTLKIYKSDIPEDFESGTVRLVLTQNGSTQTVFEGTLTKTDFPYTFQMTGESGVSTGTVKMYIDDVAVDGTFTVNFSEAG